MLVGYMGIVWGKRGHDAVAKASAHNQDKLEYTSPLRLLKIRE
jgi:hypothetical protein